MAFVKALTEEEYNEARNFISHDMTFVGVLGTRHGADTYIEDMKKMRFTYQVHKAFVDGNDVCLWYDIDMAGTTIPSCGWYQVEEGKIKSFKVLFDPRPVLEASNKK